MMSRRGLCSAIAGVARVGAAAAAEGEAWPTRARYRSQFERFVGNDVAATVKLAKDANILPTN